jgi:hypothetical protein
MHVVWSGGVFMMAKNFYLRADQIMPLVNGYGPCFATDMITVDGHKVGYIYREKDQDARFSGWVFMTGRETQEYMDNSDNIAIYDVNTIANYDPQIVPFLDAPPGSAFARNSDTGEFEEEDFSPIE